MNLQPSLSNNRVTLVPLKVEDFEALYDVASDPPLWEQHPNPDRYKREVFETFFEGAMLSGGAFKIIENSTGKVVGSTRFYDWNDETKTILIGYTFIARSCWGKGLNRSVKMLMVDYAFQFARKIHFHIGTQNVRSQIAIERIGARKIAELKIAYHGETEKQNFIYELEKNELH